jgi:hypothetical protein
MNSADRARAAFAAGAALLLFSLAAGGAAQDRSPLGQGSVSVAGVGGQNFIAGRHGYAEYAMPSLEAGKFVSRRIEIGLMASPYMSIRQPRGDAGEGGYETVTAFALDAYGRWYFAPVEWRVRPYLEAAYGPFYALEPVPVAGSRFNFLLQTGAGFTYPMPLLDPWSLLLGYRFVHVSNAHIYERNPGWQFYGVVVGVRKAL